MRCRLPTILDFLDATPTVRCDGHSLLDQDFAGRPEKRYFGGTTLDPVSADLQVRSDALRSLRQRYPIRPARDAVIRIGLHDAWLDRNVAELNLAERSDPESTLANWHGIQTRDPGGARFWDDVP
jgi:hypothetical protein